MASRSIPARSALVPRGLLRPGTGKNNSAALHGWLGTHYGRNPVRYALCPSSRANTLEKDRRVFNKASIQVTIALLKWWRLTEEGGSRE